MNDSADAIIPAVDKAVAILRYLGGRQGGASQAELSEALSITSTTCYRILQTLPFSQDSEPFSKPGLQRPVFWFYTRKYAKK